MPIPPIGRRQFVTTAGGALFCTLAGHHLSTDSHVDLDKLASTVPVPSTIRSANGQRAHPEYVTARASSGQTREYWIKAIKTRWDIAPTHRDGMMDTRVRAKTKFTALAYRSFSRGFARALGPPQIPGPLLEAETGDTIVVNFRNEVGVPVTIHPHGIFYTSDMDGSYKGNYTDRGGFVENKRSFQYVWEARPGTEGAWLYHDHGPMDPVPVFKGLFGPLIIRKPGVPRPDREFFLTFHSFTPLATG
jgi:FtsP/CotA-like multicopper oxidase with cupredoxin domain